CSTLEAELGPMRAHYADLMAHPERIEDILRAGALKARRLSQPLMERLRAAVGLRTPSVQASAGRSAAGKKGKDKAARFVSFRDEQEQFRFRLLAADGGELLLSEPFADPKTAGVAMGRLKSQPLDGLVTEEQGVVSIKLDGVLVCRINAAVLPQLREAIAGMAQD